MLNLGNGLSFPHELQHPRRACQIRAPTELTVARDFELTAQKMTRMDLAQLS